ncbi:MAG: VanZ family protein [Elusimicrobiota bacterium]
MSRQESAPARGRSAAGPWIALALWCAVIFGLSSLPGGGTTPVEFRDPLFYLGLAFRKLCHLVEYAVLYALARRALAGTVFADGRLASLSAFAFCVLYAVTDEWHQSFVPGRLGRWSDVLIDALGAAAARARLARGTAEISRY